MDGIWRILRGPFILPENTEKYHRCQWEKIDFDKAGCLICGGIHKCDSVKCKEVSNTGDSFICNVTGCVLSKVLVTNEWTDTCLPTDCRIKNELDNNVEVYVEELLMSSNAQESLAREREKFAELAESKFLQYLFSDNVCAENAIDVMVTIIHKIGGRIPPDFDIEARKRAVSVCTRFLTPVVATIQNSHCFRSFKYNNRQLVFGLMYLMRTGVYSHSETILPKIGNMHYLLPRECYLRSLYGVSPSVITDTENKLKFLIRHGYMRSASTPC
jgi:UL92 family